MNSDELKIWNGLETADYLQLLVGKSVIVIFPYGKIEGRLLEILEDNPEAGFWVKTRWAEIIFKSFVVSAFGIMPNEKPTIYLR